VSSLQVLLPSPPSRHSLGYYTVPFALSSIHLRRFSDGPRYPITSQEREIATSEEAESSGTDTIRVTDQDPKLAQLAVSCLLSAFADYDCDAGIPSLCFRQHLGPDMKSHYVLLHIPIEVISALLFTARHKAQQSSVRPCAALSKSLIERSTASASPRSCAAIRVTIYE